MRQQERNLIVADGRRRLLEESQYRSEEREVREAVAKKYEPELATASLLRRPITLAKMRLEIRREVEALAPGCALYLQVQGFFRR